MRLAAPDDLHEMDLVVSEDGNQSSTLNVQRILYTSWHVPEVVLRRS